MSLFRPNLDTKGRLIRCVGAIALALGAILTWPHSHTASIALAAASAFVAFEAARGWCALRACGVKTKF
ncbi:MAG: YgaP-like transmembrane domain [Chthoniobacteraceae bacterium]